MATLKKETAKVLLLVALLMILGAVLNLMHDAFLRIQKPLFGGSATGLILWLIAYLVLLVVVGLLIKLWFLPILRKGFLHIDRWR